MMGVKNMKDKIKTTSFWLSLSGALVIIADCVSKIFNLNVFSGYVKDVVIAICSVLVLLGIVTKKDVKDLSDSSKEELLYELKDAEDIDDFKE